SEHLPNPSDLRKAYINAALERRERYRVLDAVRTAKVTCGPRRTVHNLCEAAVLLVREYVPERFAEMSAWPIALTAAGAAAAAAWGAVYPTSQIFGRTLHRTSGPSKISLTFDDGPNPAITPHLLTLLDKHSVRATFFLIGKYARSSPDLARE